MTAVLTNKKVCRTHARCHPVSENCHCWYSCTGDPVRPVDTCRFPLHSLMFMKTAVFTCRDQRPHQRPRLPGTGLSAVGAAAVAAPARSAEATCPAAALQRRLLRPVAVCVGARVGLPIEPLVHLVGVHRGARQRGHRRRRQVARELPQRAQEQQLREQEQTRSGQRLNDRFVIDCPSSLMAPNTFAAHSGKEAASRHVSKRPD